MELTNKQKKNVYMKEYSKKKRKELKELKDFEGLDKEYYKILINEKDDEIKRLTELNDNVENKTKYKKFYQLNLDKKDEEIEELNNLLNQLTESKRNITEKKRLLLNFF